MSMTPPDEILDIEVVMEQVGTLVRRRWQALARDNENAASILRDSGATAEVIAVFTAAAKEAAGVAEALDEHAAKCDGHKEKQ